MGNLAAMQGTALMGQFWKRRARPRVGRFRMEEPARQPPVILGGCLSKRDGYHELLFPDENTSSGVFVGFGTPYDPVPDPEDDGEDVVAFANFMRSTKAPARA